MAIADESPHDDAAVTLRAIDWRSTFPFTLIFRSFRVAVHPSKLVLALIALLLIYAGGNLLDAIWKTRPHAVPNVVVFRGPQTYITPSWYPSKHELHRQVPTWNYRVVHVHGRLYVRDNERFVRGVVARLTRTHEAQAGSPKPWKMTDASPEYIDQMLANIVGIEIDITKLVGKWKLSQNKDERDRVNAADQLRKRGEHGISAAMLKTVSTNDTGA